MGLQYIQPSLELRRTLPGDLFCLIRGRTADLAIHDSNVRAAMRKLQLRSDTRHRVHMRPATAHAVDMRKRGWTG